MREKMEIYKYGPLTYVLQGMNESLGNYYWAGKNPVGYDRDKIPIDEDGNQCLDILCPLHPSYIPTALSYNPCLNITLPTIDSFKEWFEDNFLEIDDMKAKKYILRWYSFQKTKAENYKQLQQSCSSVEEVIGQIWPDEPTS